MKNDSSNHTAEFVRVWGLLALIVVAAFAVTYRYVSSPPPRVLRIATGMTDGAYYAFAREYARRLAADGLTLEVVPTAGSVENYRLLERGEVSLALVQGGSATAEDRRSLQSLGSLFLEPVWVFVRADSGVREVADLRGKRIDVGARGSGTDRLASSLLAAAGITDATATLIRSDSPANLLATGQVEAALVVASAEAPVVHALAAQRGIELVGIARAEAYSRRFRFLSPVTIDEGVLDLARDLPPKTTTTVATSASLAARSDLNAALVPALLNAITRVHDAGGVLEDRHQFPSVDFADLPLNDDAARYIRNGPSFLYRWLPYGTAVVLDRLKLLLVPLFALAIPLFRLAPPLYQWRIRSRIYRWYGEVRDIDMRLLSGSAADSTWSDRASSSWNGRWRRCPCRWRMRGSSITCGCTSDCSRNGWRR